MTANFVFGLVDPLSRRTMVIYYRECIWIFNIYILSNYGAETREKSRYKFHHSYVRSESEHFLEGEDVTDRHTVTAT